MKKNSIDQSTEFQYSSEWIHELEPEEHWRLYWKQQSYFQKVLKLGDSILEIGVGSGFTATYLRSKGFSVKTADIDKAKQPDLVMNLATERIQGEYDIVSAFEVFEHIPLKYLSGILDNIAATKLRYLLVSLPDHYPTFISIGGRIPILKKYKFSLRRPKLLPNREITDFHHWEVNMDDSVSVKSLVKYFTQAGFKLCEHDIFLDRHFFLLELN